jgi:exopolyphosphatase/guanosine-5'-triphosphate,3'-diphosphate pyrophosphatase
VSTRISHQPAIDLAVADVAAKYPADPRHVAHVADQAILLFDLLAARHRLTACDRTLLHHAGLLHDSGMWISAKDHHRHSAYIVRSEALLDSYPAAERDLLARLVRNHRKRPRPAPHNWPKRRQITLCWLSALLRTADALDRAHDQRAKFSSVRRHGSAYVLSVSGVDQSRFDRALEKKSRLLAELLGKDLRFAVSRS